MDNETRGNCSEYEDVSVGPALLYQVFGYQILLLYSIVTLLLVLVWTYTSYYSFISHNTTFLFTYLQISPALLLTIAPLPLLSPSTASLTALVQDLLTASTMLAYYRISLLHIKGKENILTSGSERVFLCPLGTPPCCCLLCCPKPRLTPRLVTWILAPLHVLVPLLVLNLIVNVAMIYSGIPPAQGFLEVTNIQNIILIPFFFSSMYTYKVFISICEEKQRGSYPKLRGMLNFFNFVVVKSTVGTFNSLGDFELLPTVDQLPCKILATIFLPVVQLVLLLISVLVIPPLYHKYSEIQISTGDNEAFDVCESVGNPANTLTLLVPHNQNQGHHEGEKGEEEEDE